MLFFPTGTGDFTGPNGETFKMRGVYGCLCFGEYWNEERIFCRDNLDPYIYGMTIRTPEPVPEPASFILLSAGLAGALVRARWRR